MAKFKSKMHIWKSKIWRNLIRKYSKILLFFFKVSLVSHHAKKIVICYLVPANSHDKVWPHYCFKQQKMNFEEFVFFKCEKKWPKQISHNFSVKKSYKKNIFFEFFVILFFFMENKQILSKTTQNWQKHVFTLCENILRKIT